MLNALLSQTPVGQAAEAHRHAYNAAFEELCHASMTGNHIHPAPYGRTASAHNVTESRSLPAARLNVSSGAPAYRATSALT
jgi:hypothetical protein